MNDTPAQDTSSPETVEITWEELLEVFDALCPSVPTLDDEAFTTEVLDRTPPSRTVCVMFFNRGCPHCHTLAAVLEPLAARGRRIVKVDCSVSAKTAERFAIHAYPMLALFRGGGLRDLYAYERNEEDIELWIKHFSGEQPAC